ncbi:alanine--glyoxylate aminotransferase 2, mitochondrial isoform X4 [Melopsittacus undulatus]|uniref:alanine--glyoxylate aminotransferase 2, mitochondrial isoform X4 n=1 Tax=Melopsittacus undulatus TaxID=13146 RepID=UPI00146CB3C0|nr:alanine--glyoxylate aminotransferase 2, mitochondrial isoform X4 [Melopsittacus undulatus]
MAVGCALPLRGSSRGLGCVVFRQQKWKSSVSTKAKMPPCNFVPEKYKSHSYERMQKIREQNISPSLRTFYKKPLLLHQGHMQWLFDYEGRRYLDLFAGIVTVGVGHCHPKVTMATQKQLARLWHTSSIYMHPSIQEYAEKLTSLFPDPLKVVYLTNSGSEANDLAMFMARLYTRNFDIISFRGAYHGGSPYTLGLTSVGLYKHGVANGFGCLTGVNGAVQYPRGFLKEAYQLVRERQGVCISDEVQTGFGRTGSHFWGFQTHGVVPDIVTLAKGIGNGFPMAAVVTTKEIASSLAQNLHINTFGGNPLACTVGAAVLDAIEEDGLQKNSEDVGTYMLLELAKLRDKFKIVGDVRGKGLMIGVEMVTDKDHRHPLPAEEVGQILEDCKDMGVLIGRGGLYSQTFRFKPPMCITKKDVDFAVEVFDTALQRHMERAAAKQT